MVRTPCYNSCIKSVVMAFVIELVLAYVKAFCQRADWLEVRGAVLNSYNLIEHAMVGCCLKVELHEKFRHVQCMCCG